MKKRRITLESILSHEIIIFRSIRDGARWLKKYHFAQGVESAVSVITNELNHRYWKKKIQMGEKPPLPPKKERIIYGEFKVRY